jgi:hypothetical protein
LVAHVNYIRADPNLITLRFDDGTSGFIYGRKHLGDNDFWEQDRLLGGITCVIYVSTFMFWLSLPGAPSSEGMYVRVWATLTSDDNGTSLMIEEVRPVTDRHELLYHVFNVALVHGAHGLGNLPPLVRLSSK